MAGRITVRTVKGREHRVRMKDGTFVRFIPATENGRVVLEFPDADPTAKVVRLRPETKAAIVALLSNKEGQ